MAAGEYVNASRFDHDRRPGGDRRRDQRDRPVRDQPLAYVRNLLGIDPDGVVHIAGRLLDEADGPVLKTRLQGFHGQPIALPCRSGDRPDPVRLQTRFDLFVAAA